MSASYPAAIPSFTTKIDNVDVNWAAHVNRLQDEVRALSTELGVVPKGPFGSVRERLEALGTGKADVGHHHDERYFQRALVTSKGQVLVGSSAGNLAAVSPAPDGRVFITDSSTPTGTRWGTLSHSMFNDVTADNYPQYARSDGSRGAFLRTSGGTVDGPVTFMAGFGEFVELRPPSSGPVEFDAAAHSAYRMRMTGNIAVTLTGAQTNVARPITILFQQDEVGGHDWTSWGPSVVWMGSGPPSPGPAWSFALVSAVSFDGGINWVAIALDQY